MCPCFFCRKKSRHLQPVLTKKEEGALYNQVYCMDQEGFIYGVFDERKGRVP